IDLVVPVEIADRGVTEIVAREDGNRRSRLRLSVRQQQVEAAIGDARKHVGTSVAVEVGAGDRTRVERAAAARAHPLGIIRGREKRQRREKGGQQNPLYRLAS